MYLMYNFIYVELVRADTTFTTHQYYNKRKYLYNHFSSFGVLMYRYEWQLLQLT